MIRRSGWVCVYETEAAFHGDRSKLDLPRRRGVRLEVLQPEELRQLEPGLAPTFKRAVFHPDGGHTVNNFRFVKVLAGSFQRLAGEIRRQAEVGFVRSDAQTSDLQSLI